MRPVISTVMLLVTAGCAAHRPEKPYVYSVPVVVTVEKIGSRFGYATAICSMKNVGSNAMWYDATTVDDPAFSFEYKSRPMSEPYPCNGPFWGDMPPYVNRYRLAPGQSVTFVLDGPRRFLGPFRVGVWLSPEADNKTFNDDIYWSEMFTP